VGLRGDREQDPRARGVPALEPEHLQDGRVSLVRDLRRLRRGAARRIGRGGAASDRGTAPHPNESREHGDSLGAPGGRGAQAGRGPSSKVHDALRAATRA
jgi:hypothetical protein